MGAKVTLKLKGKEYKNMKSLWTRQMSLVRMKYFEKLKTTMKRDIIENHILLGKSPVKGQRFAPYTDSYKKAIRAGRYARFGKNTSPVNLKLSGDMLKSFRMNLTKKGIVIAFKDKKAKWHNEGTSKMKARRMLPFKRDEVFKPAIMRNMKRILTDLVKKAF